MQDSSSCRGYVLYPARTDTLHWEFAFTTSNSCSVTSQSRSFLFVFRLRRQFPWANVSSTLVPWADFPFLDVLLTVAAAQRAASAPSNRSRSFQGQVRSLIHTAGCPACLRAHPSLSLPFVISFTSFPISYFFRSRYLLVFRDSVSAFFLSFYTLREF